MGPHVITAAHCFDITADKRMMFIRLRKFFNYSVNPGRTGQLVTGFLVCCYISKSLSRSLDNLRYPLQDEVLLLISSNGHRLRPVM